MKGHIPGMKGNLPGMKGKLPGMQGNLPGMLGLTFWEHHSDRVDVDGSFEIRRKNCS